MRIFLSYASEDLALARQLALSLGRTHRVFFDRSSLGGGDEFDSRIRKEIERCDLFVFLISPEAVTTGRYTLTELEILERRHRHPAGVLLPVVVRDAPVAARPAYVNVVIAFEPKGDATASIAAQIAKIARDRSSRRATWIGAGGSFLAGVVGLVAWLGREPPRDHETGVRIESVERVRAGGPWEPDAFLVRLRARNDGRAPITFEALELESRLSDLTVEVSHETDLRSFLAVEAGREETWKVIARWRRSGQPLGEGQLPHAHEIRVCWTVGRERDCDGWASWRAAGTFEPSAVTRLDPAIGARVRATRTAALGNAIDRAGFWIALAAPNELVRVSERGDVVRRTALPDEPTTMAGSPGKYTLWVGMKDSPGLVWVGPSPSDDPPALVGTPIPSMAGHAETPFSMATDGADVWVLFDDEDHRTERLRILDLDEQPYSWVAPPYADDRDLTLDALTLVGGVDGVFGLSSTTPHYLTRFRRDGAWQVSGHDVAFVGCLSAVAARGDDLLGIACGFDLIEITRGAWPPARARGLTPANDSVGARTIQDGLDQLFDPFHWDARRLAADGDRAVVVMARYDRTTYRLEESAVISRGPRAIWREIMRSPDEIVGLDVVGDRALLVTADARGTRNAYLVHLDD